MSGADVGSRYRHPEVVIHGTLLLVAPPTRGGAVSASDQYASVRYLVTDVQAAIDFYTAHLGFTLNTSAAPAFADVVRGPLRLLLSGPASSGARATPVDAATGGRNRIHLVVGDLDAEIARLRGAHLPLRSDVVTGPGGRQVLLADPDGNLIELFQAAQRPDAAASAAP
jgi:catechol 2,3-dioxygenase-like lactoylglutathione lyase family enzyme